MKIVDGYKTVTTFLTKKNLDEIPCTCLKNVQ